MAKETFNRKVGHKGFKEIKTGSNIGGTTMGFWNQMTNNIKNNAKDRYTDYKTIDSMPEKM